MSRPRTATSSTTRARRRPVRNETQTPDPAQRPYGSWYPLVRLGHFLLMALTSCLIIMIGFSLLGVLIYLGIAVTK